MVVHSQKNKYIKYKVIFIFIAIIIAISIIIISCFFKDKEAPSKTETTSREPSAQSNFKNGQERQVLSSDKYEGSITNNSEYNNKITEKSDWSISKDDAITVYSPLKDSLFSSGDIVAGESTYEYVTLRLIDNISGVITEGRITCNDGKFSGKINFNTSAALGRLDIFFTDINGVESSTIEIPIRLT